MSVSLEDCSALVIDPNPTSRSILSAQLREFGLASVLQCGRVSDARRHLENRHFDIVLCELDFQDTGKHTQTGSELLDELRAAGRLPWSTVFIMVTGERSYAKVAEAAESALDSYLLKPFTSQSLRERVLQARRRKRTLEPIYQAIEGGEYEAAARLCNERFRSKGLYWLYAARLGAELFLRLEMHTSAQHLLQAVMEAQALPWARLGLARAQLGQQQVAPATRTLESLIHDEPTFVDAYDVLGRTQLSQGHLSKALETYRQAADITPGAVRRQQKLGMLAFFSGEDDTALAALERACILGLNSKMFDYQTVVLLAVLRFRKQDSKGLARCRSDLGKALERAPMSLRLQRLFATVRCLELMQQRQVGAVIQQLREFATQIRAPDFDVEAGCNLLALLAQLSAAELSLPGVEEWVRHIGTRFAGTKGVSELLAHAAGIHPPHAELIKQCHAQIIEAAEKAMMHSISGAPDKAVELLLQHGRHTLNYKFIETARGVLKRYAEKIGERMSDLQQQLAIVAELTGQRGSTSMPMGQNDEGLGGIKVRGPAEAKPAAPVAAAA